MENSELPVNLFYWALAAAPIVVLLVLLVGLRWSATEAAPVGMFIAAGVALLAYRAPWESVDVCEKSGSELRAAHPWRVPGLVRDFKEKAERRTSTGAVAGDLASLFVEVAEDREPASDLGRQPGPLSGTGRVPLDSVTSDVSGASNSSATVHGWPRRLGELPMPLPDPSRARRS